MAKRKAAKNKERTEKDEVQEDIERYAALAAFASSEAGEVIFTALGKEIAATVSEIATGYHTLSEAELRALGAKLETRITFLQSLKRAPTNLEDAEAYMKELIA